MLRLFLLLLFFLSILAQGEETTLSFTPEEKAWLEAHPVVTAAGESDWPPYDFADARGVHTGIAADYLERIGKLLGIRIDVKVGETWEGILQEARERKVDLLPAVYWNEERLAYLAYTRPYGAASDFIYVRDGTPVPSSIQELDGKKVAVIRGYTLENTLARNYPQIRQVKVETTLDALKALVSGKVDAFIGDVGSTNFNIEHHFLTGLKIAAPASPVPTDIHMAVRNDWPLFPGLVQKALDAIPQEEHRAIRQKWMGWTPKRETLAFTREEKAWFRDHPAVTVGVQTHWPPISFMEEGKAHQGVDADLLEALNQRLGGMIKILPGSFDENMARLRNGEIDALMDATPTPERERFALFTDPYVGIPHTFVAPKGAPPIRSGDDLAGKRLALEKGYANVDYFRQTFPKVQVLEYPTTLAALEAVARGEADAYAGNRAVATWLTEEKMLLGLEFQGVVENRGSLLSFAVNKEEPLLAEILQKGLDDIPLEEERTMLRKWVFPDEAEEITERIPLTVEEEAWVKAHPVIRVSSEPDYAPWDFWDQGNPAGYSVDYVALLLEKIGLQPRFVQGEWNDLVGKAQNHELDLIHTLYKNESHQHLIHTPPYRTVVTAIYVKKGNEAIDSVEKLAGKRVAIPAGDSTSIALEKAVGDVTFLHPKGYVDALKLVATGKADATILDMAVADWLVLKNSIPNLTASAEVELDPALLQRKYHMAVRDDWPELAALLEKAMKAVTRREIRELEAAWLRPPEESGVQQLKLTPEEEAWLEAHPTLRFAGDPNWLPLEAFDDEGNYVGIVADHLKMLEEMLGVRFNRIRTRNFNETAEIAKRGEVDVISEVVESDLASDFTFTDPYIANPIVIVMNRRENYVEDLSRLKGKKIAAIRGYGYMPKVAATYPEIEFTYVENIQEGLTAVSTGKVDAFICTFILGSYHISKMGLANIKIVGKTRVVTQLGLGVRKDLAPLVPILNKALAAIDEPVRQEIMTRWIRQEYVEKTDYTLLFQLLGVAALVLGVIVVWNRRLSQAKEQIQELNATLEEKVREKTAELSSLVKVFDANVIASKTDLQGRITYVSQAFCAITGYREEELLGKNHNVIHHPEMPDTLFRELWTTIKQGKTWRGEIKNRKRDGGFYWVDVTITPDRNPGGKIIGYSAVRQDITAKKALEAYQDQLESLVEERTNELEDQKTFLDSVMDSQTAMVLSTDGQTIRTVNKAFLDFFDDYPGLEAFKSAHDCICDTFVKEPVENGYLQKEIYGQTWIDFLLDHPETVHRAKIRRSGKLHIFAVTAAQMTFKGEPLYTSVFNDITAMEEARELLAREKETVQTIFDSTYDPIVIHDFEGNVLRSNQKFLEIFGIGEEELADLNIRDISHPSNRFEEAAPYFAKVLTGETVQFEWTAIRPTTGERIFVEVGLNRIRLEGEEQILANIHDITERKEMEAELQEGRARVELALRGGNLGFWDVNLETGQTIVNERWANMLGYTLEEIQPVIRETWVRTLHPEDRKRVLEAGREYRDGHLDEYNLEYRAVTKTGDTRWIVSKGAIVDRGPERKATRMVGTVQDVTERKEWETALQAAKEAAEAATRSKSEFLANMSHEIRTPMNAVIGFTELMEKTELTPRQKNYLTSIKAGGKGLLTIINDILDLSKIEAGKMQLQPEPVTPRNIFRDLKQIFSAKMEEKGLEFLLDVDPELPETLVLDETRLRQILFNLVGNAIKFTDRGHIAVRVARENPDEIHSKLDLIIAVEDTGIGIPEDQQAKVFQKFEQTDGQSTRKYGGTGLGLAISAKLAEMMGGGLSLESEPGKGSTFTLHLHGVDVAGGEAADRSAESFDPDALRFAPASILVVDDVEANRELVREYLARDEFTIRTAANGKEALALLEAAPADLVITDIRMPEMDGNELVRAVKGHPTWAKIPVVALTASAMEREEKEIRSLFDGYLKKPVALAQLYGEVARHLEHTAARTVPEEREEEALFPGGAPENLAQLAETLTGPLATKKQEAQSSGDFNKIKAFAAELETFGEDNALPPVAALARELSGAVESFDIEGMGTVMNRYDTMVQALIKDS